MIAKEFKIISGGYEIESFIKGIERFFEEDWDNITNYYSGKLKSINSEPFTRFQKLKTELTTIFSLIQGNKAKLKFTYWIDFIDWIEEIDNKFSTLTNINKWARSSQTSFGYSPYTITSYQISSGETLEAINRKFGGSDWMKIAIDNGLREIDYGIEGGELLNLKFRNSVSNLKIESVVDIMVGDRVYGKDLNRYFSWDRTKKDLSALTPRETLFQTIEILLNHKKNDHPDYPFTGLQSSVAIGSNRNLLNFPIIGRQLTENFSSDDTLKNFKMVELKIKEDNLLISFSVETRLGELITAEKQL
jgi:hypothetical protein